MAITIGKQVTATTEVNLRKGAGLDYAIIGKLAPNEVVTIAAGPVYYNGLTWWQLSSGAWAAESYAGKALLVDPTAHETLLIAELAQRYGVDERKVTAVIQVESGGRGFVNDRLVIRFEPHIFEMRTQHDPAVGQFFAMGSPKWIGDHHRLRTSPDAAWQSFHGNQDREWLAVTLASTIDVEAAWQSCSMGAPQLMGFHHKALGYESACEMMTAFYGGVGVQIDAMFRWMDSSGALAALKIGNYLGFATIYNGSGQAQHYAQLIKQLV
jgi:N-acetylmuramidase